MGCGACGPSTHSGGAPACCGQPMKDQGDRYVCQVSGSHTKAK